MKSRPVQSAPPAPTASWTIMRSLGDVDEREKEVDIAPAGSKALSLLSTASWELEDTRLDFVVVDDFVVVLRVDVDDEVVVVVVEFWDTLIVIGLPIWKWRYSSELEES
jgi:hypothetical protein